MKQLIIRSITGLLFVAIVIFSIWIGKIVLLNVFLIFTCFALYEYRNLLLGKEIKLSPWFFLIALILYFILGYVPFWVVPTIQKAFPLLAVSLCFLLFLIELFRKSQSKPFQNIAYSILGLIWIVVPFALINHVPELTGDGKFLLLIFFIIIWLSDTFAYCIGSLIGKHAFSPKISPKKTWEGFIGSMVCTMAIAYFLPSIFPITTLSGLECVGFAFILIIIGTFGDLIESMFKRQMEVKDSGFILPGHGGILDRFDSTLFSIPFILLYLQIII